QSSLDRADVDQRTAALDQSRQRCLCEQPGGFEINREHRVPVLLRHRDGIEVRVDARVVDEPVETVKYAPCIRDRALDLLEYSNIAPKEMRGAAIGESCGGVDPGRVDVEQRNS